MKALFLDESGDHNLSVIDPRTLRAVGQTLLELIYREAAGRF